MRMTRIALKKGPSGNTAAAAMRYLDTFVTGRYEFDMDDCQLGVILSHPEDACVFLNQSRLLVAQVSHHG